MSGSEGAAEKRLFADCARAAGLIVGTDTDANLPSGSISFTIGYWRKANAIHAWFVNNVQGGVDDRRAASVTREQLSELRAICQRVLDGSPLAEGNVKTGEVWIMENGALKRTVNRTPGQIIIDPSVANELLPTKAGFFFGNTEFDEGYIQDLRDTIAIMDRALAPKFNNWSFTYHASW